MSMVGGDFLQVYGDEKGLLISFLPRFVELHRYLLLHRYS